MATIRAVIVDPDGTVQATQIENNLKSFQDIVGGYIEGVLGSEATMYVNEEGLLRGLPPNPVATQFAQFILGRNVLLVGTALILGPPDDEGSDTPVRPTVVGYLTKEN